MLDIYASERKKILEVGMVMQRKWDDLVKKIDTADPTSHRSSELMQTWATEATNRYAEAGFKVVVDITPAMANISPPSISIEDRVVKELTDHERIRHEILKEGK